MGPTSMEKLFHLRRPGCLPCQRQKRQETKWMQSPSKWGQLRRHRLRTHRILSRQPGSLRPAAPTTRGCLATAGKLRQSRTNPEKRKMGGVAEVLISHFLCKEFETIP